MPDIGMIELILIGMIAFLVLGPERLPEFFAQIAGFMRQGRKWIYDLKSQFDLEKQQLIRPVEEMKQSIQTSIEESKEQVKQKSEDNPP
ncbi:MAG: twin-arginine translocase TatA/TatE family subunit [Mariprofundaceae bacterium]|nr:twin-arginine translocase TatA/TatE family subunit [Mariprofundaceae bacterium]